MPKFRTWTPEEHAWALECASAGDTFEEIGEALDCPDFHEVWARLGVEKPLTKRQLAIAELYAAGVSLRAIADEVFSDRPYRQRVFGALRTMRGYGYSLPQRSPTPGRVSPEERARIAAGAARWTNARERNTALAAVVGTGPSYSELAQRFGTSRSAIAGVHRRVKAWTSQGQAHG